MPLSDPRRGRSAVRFLLVTALTLAVGLVAQDGATAAPKPTVEQVRKQTETLRGQAETATENYNAARENLSSLNIRLAAARTKLGDQRKAVAAARAGLGKIAVDTYKAGDLATLSLLLGDNPDEYLTANGLLTSLGDRKAQAVDDLLHQRRLMVGSMTDIQEQQQRVQQTEHALEISKQDVERKLKQATDLLRQLSPDQRRQMDKEARDRDRAALAEAGLPVPPSGDVTCKDVPMGTVDARAAKAINYACAQLGDPYQWGASGPGRFDCSGLTMMAWRQAGVSLPHNAAMQATYGTTVSAKDLRAGDLVFFHSPIGHVGIYLGSGLMIHAPRAGEVVKITAVRYLGGYSTAVRL